MPWLDPRAGGVNLSNDMSEPTSPESPRGDSALLARIDGHQTLEIPNREILVVEDEAAFRFLVVQFLRSRGYVVHEAGDGLEALNRLGAHPVGLIISDVCMPDCDGIELLSRLRRQRPQAGIVVMSGGMLSGMAGALAGDPSLFLKMAKALGAHRTLAKPFSLDELLTIVREMIGPAA